MKNQFWRALKCFAYISFRRKRGSQSLPKASQNCPQNQSRDSSRISLLKIRNATDIWAAQKPLKTVPKIRVEIAVAFPSSRYEMRLISGLMFAAAAADAQRTLRERSDNAQGPLRGCSEVLRGVQRPLRAAAAAARRPPPAARGPPSAARRRRRRFYIYHKLPIDRPTWRLYW